MLSPSQQAYQLLKKSFEALAPMKRFILMPAICGLLDIAILGAILAPIHRLEMLQQPLSKLQWEHFAIFFLLYLFFLYLTHLLFYFSHATLLSGFMAQIQGEPPNLRKSLKLAFLRYPALFAWVTFASTLGFIIVLARPWIKNLFGFEKRLSGQPWAIASYFIIPVILEQNIGPFAALERSAMLMSKTWGSPLMPRFKSLGLLILSSLLCAIPALITAFVPIKAMFVVGIGLSGILFFALSIIYISARTLLMGSLYEYAMERGHRLRQDPKLLESAFMVLPDPLDK